MFVQSAMHQPSDIQGKHQTEGFRYPKQCTMDKTIFTSTDVQCMWQAQAERAFWSAKDQRLQKEMFDLNASWTRLRHQDQRASFCHDVTTDADKFEKIILPLEHRINKVTNIDLGSRMLYLDSHQIDAERCSLSPFGNKHRV